MPWLVVPCSSFACGRSLAGVKPALIITGCPHKGMLMPCGPHLLLQEFETEYGAELEGMQTFASYKYPRSDVAELRPGPAVTAARAFTPDMLDSPYDGSVRRVGAFTMKPATAAGEGPGGAVHAAAWPDRRVASAQWA